ncbi:MAG: rhomboid family intramembrane serine protease [Candidatus Bathyarchaeota archaeon]|nr:rhomboid family intramembrane serine protease [Candidatus Bathyarchaeota archaeon]
MFPIHDENRPKRKPYVNYGLLLINIVVFFSFLLQGPTMLVRGIRDFGAIPSSILEGQKLWGLLTSMFMHADIIHLFGNMLYLWVFGDNIEDALGHVQYLVFYLLGGLVATFTHIASLFVTLPSFGSAGFNIPSVGASGAISAVLGAYLLLYPRAKIRTLIFYIFISIITVPAIYYLGFWFIYQLMMGVFSLTGLSSGVAFWAHIGGFAAGLLTVKVLRIKPRLTGVAAARRRPVTPLVVGPRVNRPLVDVRVERDKVEVLAEMPGVEQEDIEINVSESEVVISAEHGETRFHERISLPALVIPQIHDFSYRNGVLSFSLYKRQ